MLNLDAKRRKGFFVSCTWCEKIFYVNNLSANYRSHKKSDSRYFCSKKCVGKYGAYIQNGGEIIAVEAKEPIYFYLKKKYSRIKKYD